MSELHSRITNLPTLDDKYVQAALTAEYYIAESPHGYKSRAVLFEQSDFFKQLKQKFGERVRAFYIKSFPMSVYDWHVDVGRSCGVLWPIQTSAGASTYFKKPYDDPRLYQDRIDKNRIVIFWALDEVVYEAHQPTLIDTTSPHCVINNSPDERIMLNVSVGDETVKYQELKDFLESFAITSY
jgi:hypothetical protein